MSEQPWTKVPNTYWEIEDELLPGEARLLLRLIRLTNGYHVEWATASASQLKEQTGLGKTALYENKKSLIEKGLIEMDSTGPVCAYRLGPALMGSSEERPPAPPEPPRGVRSSGLVRPSEPPPPQRTPNVLSGSAPAERCGSPQRTPTGSPQRTPCTLKESRKENFKESLSSSASAPVRNDDENPEMEISEPDQADDQADLVRKLRGLGIDARAAEKIVRSTPERVEAALELAASRPDLDNPAGFVVRVCENGVYPRPEPRKICAEPPAPPEPAPPSRHALDQAADQARRDAEQLRAELEWVHLVELLGPEEVEAAEAHVRSQLPKAAATAPAEMPFIRGLMLEYLRARASPRERVS